MSLVRKSRGGDDSAVALHSVAGVVTKSVARDADAQRKRARTLAKQQQAAERVAAATSQLAAGVNEASSAAEELRRATEQIATGAEEAAGAAQQSLAAITQVSGAITRQLSAVTNAKDMALSMQTLASTINGEVRSTVVNVAVAADRQAESVKKGGEVVR